MKHQSDDEGTLLDTLESLLAEMGVEVGRDRLSCTIAYTEALLVANRAVNLTRIATMDQAMRLHILDSLLVLPEVLSSPAGAALDLGSGGGFPGVPLSIATHRDFVLLDSVAKKGNAVKGVVESLRCLQTRIEVVGARAEEYALVRPHAFAVVVARAVAPLPALVELAAPFLIEGGRLVAMKGRPDSAERDSGTAVGALVGMEETSWREFRLPGGEESRSVVVYSRNGDAKVRLPRRTGLAQHSPLA